MMDLLDEREKIWDMKHHLPAEHDIKLKIHLCCIGIIIIIINELKKKYK